MRLHVRVSGLGVCLVAALVLPTFQTIALAAPSGAAPAEGMAAEQASKAGATDEVSDDVLGALKDQAFEPFVKITLIHDAILAGDPHLLTDAALLLAKGEAELYRQHRAVSSDALFRLAIAAAARQGDQACLDRLTMALKGVGRDELVAVVQAARTVAGAARSTAVAGLVDEQASEEAKAELALLIDQVSLAERLGNAAALDEITKSTADSSLDAKAKQFLGEAIAEARATIGESEVAGEIFSLLAEESRSLHGGGASPVSQIRYTITNRTRGTVHFSLHGSGKSYSLRPGGRGSYVATFTKGKTPYAMVEQVLPPWNPPKGAGQVAIDTRKPKRTKFNLSSGNFSIVDTKSGYVLKK